MAKVKTAGYLVMESCEDYEQALGLLITKTTMPKGVLFWASCCNPAAPHLFTTRAEAREAIERTHHFARAFSHNDYPEKCHCSIVRVVVRDTDA
jgi:hypothetical protein